MLVGQVDVALSHACVTSARGKRVWHARVACARGMRVWYVLVASTCSMCALTHCGRRVRPALDNEEAHR